MSLGCIGLALYLYRWGLAWSAFLCQHTHMSYRGIDRAIAALGQINTGHMDAGDSVRSWFVWQKDGVMMVCHVLTGCKKGPTIDPLLPLMGFACGGHRFN